MEISTEMNALSLFRSEAGFVDLASIMCTSESAKTWELWSVSVH